MGQGGGIQGNISAWKWDVTDCTTLHSGGDGRPTGSARSQVVEALASFSCTSGPFAVSCSMAVGVGTAGDEPPCNAV